MRGGTILHSSFQVDTGALAISQLALLEESIGQRRRLFKCELPTKLGCYPTGYLSTGFYHTDGIRSTDSYSFPLISSSSHPGSVFPVYIISYSTIKSRRFKCFYTLTSAVALCFSFWNQHHQNNNFPQHVALKLLVRVEQPFP
jgi:hypothetical protein